MKNFNLWFILALIAIFAMTCASQWNLTHRNTAHSHTLHTAPTEHDTVKLADILLYTDRDGVMHFDTNKTKYLHGFTGDSIIHYYGYLFKIGKHNEWKLKHTIYKEREAFGNYTTYIYEAYHKGYPIDKNVFYFDVKNGQIFRGKEISIVNDLDVDTSITLT